jgi:hypothetical protein
VPLSVEFARFQSDTGVRGGANGMETVAWFPSFWVASFSSFQVAGLDHFDWLD